MKTTTKLRVGRWMNPRGLCVVLGAAVVIALRHAGLAVARRIAWAFDWLEG
jgi:hypothetical protein